jgi:serine beta-lactamase-like protein LACTB, mitochondrial
VGASSAKAVTYAEARENAERPAKEWSARGTPGLALAVTVDGRVVYSEGFAYADLEERVSVWPTTEFRVGNICTALTAVGLMEQVQTRKLELDAPIQNYVPSFPEKGQS